MSEPTGGMGRWLKLGVAPLAIYLAAFVALTWPLMESFSTHYFCDEGDGFQNVWNLWWVREALVVRGAHPWFTDMLHFPSGVTLIGQTLNWFNGLVAIPLAGALSSIQTHNGIVVFAFTMTGWTTFLLAHHISRSWWGSLFAGAAFTFSSYHFAHAQGHLDLISLQWLPLFLWAWIRFLERPGMWRASLASLVLLALVACNYYYTVYAVAAGAVLFPVYLARHRAAWKAAGLKAMGALALFVALSLATTGVFFFQLLAANRADPFADSHPPLDWSLDVGSLLIPGGHWRFAPATDTWWRSRQENDVEPSAYVGWCLLLTAAFSVWSHLRGRSRGALTWAFIGVCFGVFALGPAFNAFGHQSALGDMPYAWLERLVPAFRLSGMPLRMTVMLQLSAALLAAAGFDDLRRSLLKNPALQLLFVALFVVETLPTPIPTTRPVAPDYVAVLTQLPAGAVYDLDAPDSAWPLYYQTLFQKPIVGGYITRRPRSCVERLDRINGLFAEGRLGEFFTVSGVRYVVQANRAPGEAPPPGLRAVFVGARFSILVATADTLAAVTGARVDAVDPPPVVAAPAGVDRLEMDDAAAPHLTFGWFPPEHTHEGQMFRWTGGTATFEMSPSRSVSRVCVRLLTRPRPTPVTLTMTGGAPARQQCVGERAQVLTFPLPQVQSAGALLRFTLACEPFTPAEIGAVLDVRALGICVAEIWLE